MTKLSPNVTAILVWLVVVLGVFSDVSYAQVDDLSPNIRVNRTEQKATLSLSPHLGVFQENSTFDVAIFVDTLGESISGIFLKLIFDPSKLAIIQSVGNKSIITSWTEPPSYSNKTGLLQLNGSIKPGAVADAGLIGTATFKALVSGETIVTISPDSRVVVDDGLGTFVTTDFNTGSYTIVPRSHGGVRVYSSTHPLSPEWYNNNNPVFLWEKVPGVDDFSYVLDSYPFTIPDNQPDNVNTSVSYTNVREGLSFFHIKARSRGIWGASTHFLVRIDTSPPINLEPKLHTLSATSILSSSAIITFSADDTLSGIDHYEVGVIDKGDPLDITPVFVEAKSPYRLPRIISGKAVVVINAFDKAGNVAEAYLELTTFSSVVDFIQQNYLVFILVILLVVIIGAVVKSYLHSHKIHVTIDENNQIG
jgi:hypothetical protein